MSRTFRFNPLFALLVLTLCVPAVAAAQDRTAPAPRIVTAKIKLDDLSMIIVPVSINGFGPYDFLLDTGSAKSMVDQKLTDELALPVVSTRTIVGVLTSARTSVVHVNSLSVGGATVGAGELFSIDHPATVTGKVRGVLGEDFLKNFDVLVDYRHHVIELESVTGSLSESASGERLPLQADGTYQGQPTHNRLIISGTIPGIGDKPMALLLDSGANQVTLFRDKLEAGAGHVEQVTTGDFGAWSTSEAATRKIRSLNIGRSSLDGLTVVGLARRPYVDIDGLLPTSMFNSIFISHRDRFVILNPSFPRTSTRPELIAQQSK